LLKKGSRSAGVKRKYSDTAERIENSQVGVFLCYGIDKGATLVDRELYIAQEWAEDRERRSEARIPESLEFATKPELARRMIGRAFTLAPWPPRLQPTRFTAKTASCAGFRKRGRRPVYWLWPRTSACGSWIFIPDDG